MKVCTDYLGREHKIAESDLIDRISAYGVLIREESVLLVYERTAQRWGFPGGGVEQSEDILDGLKREFVEETKLRPNGKLLLIDAFEEYYYELDLQEAWQSRRYFYMIEAADGVLAGNGNGDDIERAAFIPINTIGDLHTDPRVIDILNKAINSNLYMRHMSNV